MGGGGGSSKPQYVPEPVINTPQFNPTPAGAWNVPQTFTPQGLPPWATGNFAMPWWGTSAATGQPLTQADLQPPPAPVAPPAAPMQLPARPQAQMPAYDLISEYQMWRNARLGQGWWGERGDNNTFQDFLLGSAFQSGRRGMGFRR